MCIHVYFTCLGDWGHRWKQQSCELWGLVACILALGTSLLLLGMQISILTFHQSLSLFLSLPSHNLSLSVFSVTLVFRFTALVCPLSLSQPSPSYFSNPPPHKHKRTQNSFPFFTFCICVTVSSWVDEWNENHKNGFGCAHAHMHARLGGLRGHMTLTCV